MRFVLKEKNTQNRINGNDSCALSLGHRSTDAQLYESINHCHISQRTRVLVKGFYVAHGQVCLEARSTRHRRNGNTKVVLHGVKQMYSL